jgi:pimeloyl-ACP methyl ester carboxylesterase
MPVEVIMPKVDMDMTHGTLVAWHVKEGEAVAQGQPLFDIETAKAAMEIDAPAAGRLHHVSSKAGDVVPVGATIAWLYTMDEEVGDPPKLVGAMRSEIAEIPAASANEPATSPLPPNPRSPSASQPSSPLDEVGRARATPAARKASLEHGVPLEEISGTGPRGRVQKADVPSAPPASARLAQQWQAETGALHVSRREGAGAPILLIHGFASDSESWTALERHLVKDRPIIRIDLPGHGRSPNRRIEDFRDLAKMFTHTFDLVVPPQSRVHVVGHSLGGALALALADIRARKVASLTLIAPAGLGPAIRADVLFGIAAASRVQSLMPWLRELPADPAQIKDDYARAAFRSRARSGLVAAQMHMAEVLFPDGTQSFDLRAALGRVELSTQIVWGKRDSIANFKQAIAARGTFALHLLDDIGHIPQFECPGRLARIVMQQIAGVESTYSWASGE